MGHRIEPYVSIPTKLQTDSTGYNPRVSNSHWLLFPITATIESVRISVITLSREPTIKILYALISYYSYSVSVSYSKLPSLYLF